MASNRSKLDEIVESCSALEDPRSYINRRHPLPSVLIIAVLAILAGAAGPTAIARWAELEEDLLTDILDLPRGEVRGAKASRSMTVQERLQIMRNAGLLTQEQAERAAKLETNGEPK